jgi:hypothetical protein
MNENLKTLYKRYGTKRKDLFQLHTYLRQFSNDGLPVRGGGIIYPMRESRWQALIAGGHNPWQHSKMQQQGKEIDFFTIFLRIPEKG